MNYTKSDVVTLALKLLKVIGEGEIPTPGQLADGEVQYTAFHGLVIKDIQNTYKPRGGVWDLNSVPEEIMPFVASMLAGHMIPLYPVSDDAYLRVMNAANEAKGHLHTVLSRPKKSASRFPDMPIRSSLYSGGINS